MQVHRESHLFIVYDVLPFMISVCVRGTHLMSCDYQSCLLWFGFLTHCPHLFLSAGLTRQLTYGMSRLGLFRTISQKFTPEGGTAADIPFTTMLGISLTAGGTAALIGTPADAALVRMQADTTLPVEQRRNYKWVGDALVRMAREEGLKGFFAGGTPTICRGLAINVGMFTTRDKFKQFNQNVLGMQPDGAPNRFFSGFLSGWVAATATLPFDFIKTRLQKQKPDANGQIQYKGVVDCFQKVQLSK